MWYVTTRLRLGCDISQRRHFQIKKGLSCFGEKIWDKLISHKGPTSRLFGVKIHSFYLLLLFIPNPLSFSLMPSKSSLLILGFGLNSDLGLSLDVRFVFGWRKRMGWWDFSWIWGRWDHMRVRGGEVVAWRRRRRKSGFRFLFFPPINTQLMHQYALHMSPPNKAATCVWSLPVPVGREMPHHLLSKGMARGFGSKILFLS